MRYFRVIYEVTDCRETTIEVHDETLNEHDIEKIFEGNFDKYDIESEPYDCPNEPVTILTVDEVDENGDEI